MAAAARVEHRVDVDDRQALAPRRWRPIPNVEHRATPTPGAVQAAFETEAVARAKITEDPTVMGLITSIFAGNDWREPATSRRRRS